MTTPDLGRLTIGAWTCLWMSEDWHRLTARAARPSRATTTTSNGRTDGRSLSRPRQSRDSVFCFRPISRVVPATASPPAQAGWAELAPARSGRASGDDCGGVRAHPRPHRDGGVLGVLRLHPVASLRTLRWKGAVRLRSVGLGCVTCAVLKETINGCRQADRRVS